MNETQNIIIRNIEYDDYHKQYLQLLQHLSTIEPEKITKDDFTAFIDILNNKHQIIVVENLLTNEVLGTITILIENKLLHNNGVVCHIEDLVVNPNIRNLGIGKMLVNKALEISKNNKCYKTILDCDICNEQFYNKCNFVKKGIQMALYQR